MRSPKEPKPKSRPAPKDPVKAIQQAMPAIVDALIEQAKQGSYLHAKFLFDFARITTPSPADAEEASLAALLFRELRLEE